MGYPTSVAFLISIWNWKVDIAQSFFSIIRYIRIGRSPASGDNLCPPHLPTANLLLILVSRWTPRTSTVVSVLLHISSAAALVSGSWSSGEKDSLHSLWILATLYWPYIDFSLYWKLQWLWARENPVQNPDLFNLSETYVLTGFFFLSCSNFYSNLTCSSLVLLQHLHLTCLGFLLFLMLSLTDAIFPWSLLLLKSLLSLRAVPNFFCFKVLLLWETVPLGSCLLSPLLRSIAFLNAYISSSTKKILKTNICWTKIYCESHGGSRLSSLK